jgi:hypothetical protein
MMYIYLISVAVFEFYGSRAFQISFDLCPSVAVV